MVTVGAEFQIRLITEGFLIYTALNCIHDRTVRGDRQYVKYSRPIQCTKSGTA